MDRADVVKQLKEKAPGRFKGVDWRRFAVLWNTNDRKGSCIQHFRVDLSDQVILEESPSYIFFEN